MFVEKKEFINLMKHIEKFLVEDFAIEASQKAVNIYLYNANFKMVENLLKDKGYKLSCVCGTSEKTLRPIATKRIEISGFEIVNNIFSENVPVKDYYKLRKSLCQ